MSNSITIFSIWKMEPSILLTLTLILFIGCVKSQQPVVSTPSGKIIGKTIFVNNIPVFSFQGVPYAKPPVGEYRFKKPVPIQAWKQPIQAHNFSAACMQYSTKPYPWLDTLPVKSEDCLYLNIWMPTNASRSNKKSVLFFMHGGFFTVGSSRIDYYDGQMLAALGDVIFVSINYRLGVMGFLYSGTDDAPGNMGMYDVLEALKWVHSNIEYFGGDKNSITLFGLSAGATSVGMFMTSPLFRGLFVRAILNSGSAVNPNVENTNAINFRLTNKLARAVGCANNKVSLSNNPKEVIRCLRGVDALELCKTLGQVSGDYPLRSLYPRFGDEILPQNTRKSIIEGRFANVDVLMGYTNDEGTVLVTDNNKDYFGYLGYKNHHINKTFGEYVIRSIFRNFLDPDAVVRYFLGNVDDNNYDEILNRVTRAPGDYLIICPAIFFGEKVSEKGNRVHFHNFDHRSSVSSFAPWMGAAHFEEIPFVFGYPLRYPQYYTADELELSRILLNSWTSFARTGKPSIQQWPLYSKQFHNHLRFRTEGITTEIRPTYKDCNFFRPYFGF